MLSNVSVVEIGYSKIKQNVQNHGEIEQGKIHPKILITNCVLNRTVDAKNVQRFYKQVEKKE